MFFLSDSLWHPSAWVGKQSLVRVPHKQCMVREFNGLVHGPCMSFQFNKAVQQTLDVCLNTCLTIRQDQTRRDQSGRDWIRNTQ